MKKLIALMILFAAVMVAGCDTTETRTIKVNLGGSRAATDYVSEVSLAVFELDAEQQVVGHLMSVSSPPTGSISLVVPVNTNFWILVMGASKDSTSTFYTGETVYYGADNADDPDTVIMQEIYIMSGEVTTMDAEAYLDAVSVGGSGFYLGLKGEPMQDYDFYAFLELHLEESSNGGSSYSVIEQVNFQLVSDGISKDGFYELTNYSATAGYWYRARVYCPMFDLYFFTWLETESFNGK